MYPQAELVPQLASLLRGSAQRLVELLVRQGWSVLDFETLPIGVALPLKEALHACRLAPPQGWPAEAYALVGRWAHASIACTKAVCVVLLAGPALKYQLIFN